MSLRLSPAGVLVSSLLYASTVQADWSCGSGVDSSISYLPFLCSNRDDFSLEDLYDGPFSFIAPGSSGRRALIAHGVIASLVFVFLLPVGGILLRLPVRSPIMIKLHAILQMFSGVLYLSAVGIGIWLVQKMSLNGWVSLWNDPHPVLGLVILGLVCVQPFLGALHHRIFMQRLSSMKEGQEGPPPGRTPASFVHIWVGRVLLFLGIVNGGLGIRLARRTPFQSQDSLRSAAIAYGVFAAVMFVVYTYVTVTFERNKVKNDEDIAATQAVVMPPRDLSPMRYQPPTQATTTEIPPPYTVTQNSRLRGRPQSTMFEVRYELDSTSPAASPTLALSRTAASSMRTAPSTRTFPSTRTAPSACTA